MPDSTPSSLLVCSIAVLSAASLCGIQRDSSTLHRYTNWKNIRTETRHLETKPDMHNLMVSLEFSSTVKSGTDTTSLNNNQDFLILV